MAMGLVAMLTATDLTAQSNKKALAKTGNEPPGKESNFSMPCCRQMSLEQYNRARQAFSVTRSRPEAKYFHSTWVAGAYFNYYDNVRTFGLIGEYHMHRDIYVSANVGYRDLEYSGDFIRFLEFQADANYQFLNFKHIVYASAFAGVNTSTLDLREVETSMPEYRMLVSGMVGGELMVRISNKWFAFSDFRQMLALNAKGNNGVIWLQVWSLGVKKSIKF